MKELVLLGDETSFTSIAAKKRFPQEKSIIYVPLIAEIVEIVEAGEARRGVIPIENKYDGEIDEGLDALAECDHTRITEELSDNIVHCLGASPEHGLIEIVYSKDTALNQCKVYLKQNYKTSKRRTTDNTSAAAEKVARERLLNAAAISSEAALKKFNLETLARDLCPNNRTRFGVVSRERYAGPTGDDKTFVVLYPAEDKPGILHGLLTDFKEHNINLNYIKSRPDGREGYVFYVEFNGHFQDEKIARILRKINVKILGSYANTHWKKG